MLCPLVDSSYSPAYCSADLQGQAELAAVLQAAAASHHPPRRSLN